MRASDGPTLVGYLRVEGQIEGSVISLLGQEGKDLLASHVDDRYIVIDDQGKGSLPKSRCESIVQQESETVIESETLRLPILGDEAGIVWGFWVPSIHAVCGAFFRISQMQFIQADSNIYRVQRHITGVRDSNGG